MKPCYFHPAALTDIESAAEYYDDQREGVGRRLIDLVAQKLTRISENPKLYPNLKDNIRKCRLGGYPFSLIFREQAEQIEILALAHHRRQPNFWQNRTDT